MPQTIEISRRTVTFILLVLLGFWLVTRIVDILFMVFVSLILTSAVNPFVDKLQRLRFPRWVSVTIVYLAIWGVMAALVAIVIPALVDQSTRLIGILPSSLNSIQYFNSHQAEINTEIFNRLGGLPETLVGFTFTVFGNLFNVFTTLIITFYLLLERDHLKKYLGLILKGRDTVKMVAIITQVESRLGQWVRGQLVLMLSVGLLTYVGLFILGVDIALPLAVLAGVLEIVPAIGPILSVIPTVIITLSMGPLITLAAISLYVLVQLFENHIMIPSVMRHTVGINPIVAILSLLIGFRLAGGSGAVLAIPIILVAQVIASEAFNLKILPGDE